VIKARSIFHSTVDHIEWSKCNVFTLFCGDWTTPSFVEQGELSIATIGAGEVVVHDLTADCTVVGVLA